MGHRKERLDNRIHRQKETRAKNSPRKGKERVRRAARVAARERRMAEKLSAAAQVTAPAGEAKPEVQAQ